MDRKLKLRRFRAPVDGLMITLEDCLAFCDLTEEEVLAIAEHEHMPEIAAIAYGQFMLNKEHGTEQILKMIVDDIRAAQRRGDGGADRPHRSPRRGQRHAGPLRGGIPGDVLRERLPTQRFVWRSACTL